jgi:hypothetical protein
MSTARSVRRVVHRMLLAAGLLTALTLPALAQDATVLGTIEGTVDGEPRSWVQIEVPGQDGPQPLSSWANSFMTVHDVTIQGFAEPRFLLQDALSISVVDSSGLPTDCPCTYDETAASVLYLSSGSMTEDLHMSDDGGSVRLTFDVFEPIGEGVYRVEGSFEATLPFRESPLASPDLERAIEVAGTFTVDRLPELSIE